MNLISKCLPFRLTIIENTLNSSRSQTRFLVTKTLNLSTNPNPHKKSNPLLVYNSHTLSRLSQTLIQGQINATQLFESNSNFRILSFLPLEHFDLRYDSLSFSCSLFSELCKDKFFYLARCPFIDSELC